MTADEQSTGSAGVPPAAGTPPPTSASPANGPVPSSTCSPAWPPSPRRRWSTSAAARGPDGDTGAALARRACDRGGLVAEMLAAAAAPPSRPRGVRARRRPRLGAGRDGRRRRQQRRPALGARSRRRPHAGGPGGSRPAAGWRCRCPATSALPRTPCSPSCACPPLVVAARRGRTPARTPSSSPPATSTSSPRPGWTPTCGRRPICTCSPGRTRCWAGSGPPSCGRCSPCSGRRGRGVHRRVRRRAAGRLPRPARRHDAAAVPPGVRRRFPPVLIPEVPCRSPPCTTSRSPAPPAARTPCAPSTAWCSA